MVGQVGSPKNPLRLLNLDKYPSILVKFSPGKGVRHNSSAVGRYQFNKKDFQRAWKQFGSVPDFGHDSQDLVAVEDMMLVGMIDPLMKDDPQQALLNGHDMSGPASLARPTVRER